MHRQGSVALLKPCNLSLKFSSMPSLSPNKFALNLLAASAFQGHALYNLLPTKLQKANKRAMEGGLKQHYNGQPEPQLLLHTKQALFWQADAEYEGRWEVSVLFIPVICRRCSETGQECSSLQLDSARPESSSPCHGLPWSSLPLTEMPPVTTDTIHSHTSFREWLLYKSCLKVSKFSPKKNPLGTANLHWTMVEKKKKKKGLVRFIQDSFNCSNQRLWLYLTYYRYKWNKASKI